MGSHTQLMWHWHTEKPFCACDTHGHVHSCHPSTFVTKGALNRLSKMYTMHMQQQCVMVRVLHLTLFASLQLLPTWKICMGRQILGVRPDMNMDIVAVVIEEVEVTGTSSMEEPIWMNSEVTTCTCTSREGVTSIVLHCTAIHHFSLRALQPHQQQWAVMKASEKTPGPPEGWAGQWPQSYYNKLHLLPSLAIKEVGPLPQVTSISELGNSLKV